MNLFTKPSNKSFSTFPDKQIVFIVFVLLVLCCIRSKAGTGLIPDMPGLITGQTNVCAYVGTGQQSTYSIAPVPGAEVYLWTVPPTVNIISGQGTISLTITFSAAFTASFNKQLRVRAVSQDGFSADRIFYLTSQLPSTPAVINGPTNACLYIGTSNQATYSTSRDPAASSYIWGSNSAATTISHPNGSGANDTIILVKFKAGYKTSPITVQAINNCGFSTSRILNVSGAAPTTPGIITGPTNVCGYMLPNGTAASYSIRPVQGALSYIWNVPEGCIIEHPNGAGANDISVTVQYPPDFTGGSIKVIASSGCDDSNPRSLTVTKLNPATPGLISVVQTIVCPNREYVYKLPGMPSNASAINWKAPVDALSTSGQGSAMLTVTYPEEPVNGVVTATAVNNCASSATRQSIVRLGRCQLEKHSFTERNSNIPADEEEKIKVNSHAMEVNIAPNPSKENFKIQITSATKETVFIKVLDLQGREIKKLSALPNQVLIFGNDFKTGTYILEVEQGSQKHTEKLMKL